ncbi:MAG: hypothetical protein GX783_09940 [Clostridiales bacterium]|nr:hypothetical protein [Clostridiales bacterium]
MELIILIIVASVISNIVKSMREAQQKTNQPNRKIPGQGDFPGKGFNLSGNQPPIINTSLSEEPYTVSHNEQNDELISNDQEAQWQIATSNLSPVASTLSPTNQADESSYAIRKEQSQRRHKLDLSPDAFVNGIILSEVLGSPKSRRH